MYEVKCMQIACGCGSNPLICGRQTRSDQAKDLNPLRTNDTGLGTETGTGGAAKRVLRYSRITIATDASCQGRSALAVGSSLLGTG